MQVRLPRIDYSTIRPDWAANREFAHDRNASSTIPSYVEPYLIQVMKRAKEVLPANETQLHAEIDWFIAQASQHYRQHNAFNRRIRAFYPGIEGGIHLTRLQGGLARFRRMVRVAQPVPAAGRT